MRAFYRSSLVAVVALLGACASDGTSAPDAATPGNIESRLIARLDGAPSLSAGNNMNMVVSVRNTLTEAVSGSVCAQAIEARPTSGTSWTDVTASGQVCSALALIANPGSTVNVTATADVAKVRALGGTAVVVRVRHQMGGDSGTSYTLQSNELQITVP
jgi:D-alanyl-D-alanine carboxypeptidase